MTNENAVPPDLKALQAALDAWARALEPEPDLCEHGQHNPTMLNSDDALAEIANRLATQWADLYAAINAALREARLVQEQLTYSPRDWGDLSWVRSMRGGIGAVIRFLDRAKTAQAYVGNRISEYAAEAGAPIEL